MEVVSPMMNRKGPGLAHNNRVINPAERNALVGIKPTVGLTSRAGYVSPQNN